jgi:hypothetical protein
LKARSEKAVAREVQRAVLRGAGVQRSARRTFVQRLGHKVPENNHTKEVDNLLAKLSSAGIDLDDVSLENRNKMVKVLNEHYSHNGYEIRWLDEDHGFGLFTLEERKSGTVAGEYCGTFVKGTPSADNER